MAEEQVKTQEAAAQTEQSSSLLDEIVETTKQRESCCSCGCRIQCAFSHVSCLFFFFFALQQARKHSPKRSLITRAEAPDCSVPASTLSEPASRSKGTSPLRRAWLVCRIHGSSNKIFSSVVALLFSVSSSS